MGKQIVLSGRFGTDFLFKNDKIDLKLIWCKAGSLHLGSRKEWKEEK